MEANTSRLLGLILQGKQPDEWWATNKPNDFVVGYLDDGPQVAYYVTVAVVDLPSLPPSAVEDGEGPHPFGWSAKRCGRCRRAYTPDELACSPQATLCRDCDRTCILTGAEGENDDDCTTHDHEGE